MSVSVNVNKCAAAAAGRARRPWRIKEWLDERGLTYANVAERAGLRAHSIVSRTVRGQVNNRRVLKTLLELGCPAGYLGLPNDLIDLPEQDKKQVA
jgi:transcriptional regulator with XRE-family HTH domain